MVETITFEEMPDGRFKKTVEMIDEDGIIISCVVQIGTVPLKPDFRYFTVEETLS